MKTSCALVGLGLPERLAEGAAKAQPLCRDDRPGHGVAGHPNAHRIQTRAALRRHLRAAGHDDGERAGAESRHQQLGALGHLADKAGQHLRAGHMDDEGVILGAALGHKNASDGFPVPGVGGNAVHRLGGQGHQFTLFQKGGGLGDAGLVGGQDFGFECFVFHTIHRSFFA